MRIVKRVYFLRYCISELDWWVYRNRGRRDDIIIIILPLLSVNYALGRWVIPLYGRLNNTTRTYLPACLPVYIHIYYIIYKFHNNNIIIYYIVPSVLRQSLKRALDRKENVGSYRYVIA